MLLATISFLSDVFVTTGLIFLTIFVGCLLPGLVLLAVFGILWFFNAN